MIGSPANTRIDSDPQELTYTSTHAAAHTILSLEEWQDDADAGALHRFAGHRRIVTKAAEPATIEDRRGARSGNGDATMPTYQV